jgi:hypothetical protein
MSKQQPSRRRVTAGEASYVLDRLIDERRISTHDVERIVAEMHREIADLERRLASLRDVAGLGRPKHRAGAGTRAENLTTHRRRHVTPELAMSRRVQGEYMGLIRHLRGEERARVKKLAAERGREAAIKAMRAAAA